MCGLNLTLRLYSLNVKTANLLCLIHLISIKDCRTQRNWFHNRFKFTCNFTVKLAYVYFIKYRVITKAGNFLKIILQTCVFDIQFFGCPFCPLSYSFLTYCCTRYDNPLRLLFQIWQQLSEWSRKHCLTKRPAINLTLTYGHLTWSSIGNI